MICQLSFGEPLGFIEEGRDVHNLIENFHKMAPFAAVVGTLPWIVRPIMESALGRWLFMPRPGDNTGTGQIMAVSFACTLSSAKLCIVQYTWAFMDPLMVRENSSEIDF